MPSLTKDSKGRSPFWTCCYSTADGRRLKKSTKQKDRAAAMEVCLSIERAERLAREGNLTEQAAKKIIGEILERTGQSLRSYKAEDWFAKWLTDTAETASPKTMDRYRQVVRDFQKSIGRRAKLPLANLTDDDVRQYRSEQSAAGRAPKTSNNAVKVLSAGFNAALRAHLIPINPCTAIVPLDEDTAARKAFTVAQVHALIATADTDDWKLAILLGYHTGARLGDVTNLLWNNFDFKRRVVSFRPKKTKKKLKIIEIPLHPELEAALLESPGVGKAPVFPSLAGRDTGGYNGLSEQFAGIMAKAGIVATVTQHTAKGRKNTDLSFHSLRHSFNSELANAGVAQELRQKLTGHKTKSANDVYTHHELAPLRAAIGVVPSVA